MIFQANSHLESPITPIATRSLCRGILGGSLLEMVLWISCYVAPGYGSTFSPRGEKILNCHRPNRWRKN